MKICMLTGLDKLKKFIDFRNAGGMGTQVPLLAKKMEERGIEVKIDDVRDCDILHIHNPMPNYIPLIKRARKKGVKVVVHARHLPELVKGGFKFGNAVYPLFHAYSKFFYNMADAIVCATPYVKNWMINNGIRKNLYVIPNGVDCSFFYPSEKMRTSFRNRYGIEDEMIIFSVGLMIPRKGIYDFVEVAKRCNDKKFIWIGSSEKGLEKVEISIPENMLHIPYLPFHEMPLAYNGGDIFFFPTYAESYGNVLMEAAACGKALVIRDIEIYREWFVHGENCLKGRNVDEFVDAIEEISRNEEMRKRLAENAQSTAQEQDISRTIDEMIKMYYELMEG